MLISHRLDDMEFAAEEEFIEQERIKNAPKARQQGQKPIDGFSLEEEFEAAEELDDKIEDEADEGGKKRCLMCGINAPKLHPMNTTLLSRFVSPHGTCAFMQVESGLLRVY